MRNMSESDILELHLRSVNYLRNEDRKIGETELRWVRRQRSPGGRYQRHRAYFRPSTREMFRVLVTEYPEREARGGASA